MKFPLNGRFLERSLSLGFVLFHKIDPSRFIIPISLWPNMLLTETDYGSLLGKNLLSRSKRIPLTFSRDISMGVSPTSDDFQAMPPCTFSSGIPDPQGKRELTCRLNRSWPSPVPRVSEGVLKSEDGLIKTEDSILNFKIMTPLF